MKKLLNLKQAALVAKYNENYLSRLARLGKVPAVKYRNKWYFERSTMEALSRMSKLIGGK